MKRSGIRLVLLGLFALASVVTTRLIRLITAMAFGALTTSFAAEPIQEVAGWMGNGLGDYSTQNPPHTWNVATGENVRWSVPLPNWSNGGPIVVNGKSHDH